jgi:hypothetical protein
MLNGGGDYTYAEVKDGKLHVKEGFESKFRKNGIVKSARAYFKEEIKRSQVLDEKNKVLLTITALLVAANAAIASKIEPKWPILISLIPTIISIFLILVHFGVQSIPIPDYRKSEQELANSYYDCMEKYQQANCFRVGVYLASCRATTFGVLLLLAVFVYFAFASKSFSEDKLIESMKNNSESRFILRAPQEEYLSGEKNIEGLQSSIKPLSNTMRDYVVVIAAIIAGVSAIISAIIAWRLNSYTTEKLRGLSLKKEKYDEFKDLYTSTFSLFENTIRQILDFDEYTFAQDFSKMNANIHLLASENITKQYNLTILALESWSSLYVKASPKRMKIGDTKCIILQAPDPTQKFIEPAKKEYEHLQEEMEKLFDLMRADLHKLQ